MAPAPISRHLAMLIMMNVMLHTFNTVHGGTSWSGTRPGAEIEALIRGSTNPISREVVEHAGAQIGQAIRWLKDALAALLHVQPVIHEKPRGEMSENQAKLLHLIRLIFTDLAKEDLGFDLRQPVPDHLIESHQDCAGELHSIEYSEDQIYSGIFNLPELQDWAITIVKEELDMASTPNV